MHEHSLEAHTIERDSGRLSKRAAQIVWVLSELRDWRKGATDRDILGALGLFDMNSVRPRITELIKCGKLEECGSMRDPATNKRVRLVRLKQVQGKLF
jgi:hypothetical protein